MRALLVPLLSAAFAETQRLCCLLTGMTGDMGADQDTGAVAAAAATVVTERACQTLLQSLSESLQLAHALLGRWGQGWLACYKSTIVMTGEDFSSTQCREHTQTLAMLTSVIARYTANWTGRRDLAI